MFFQRKNTYHIDLDKANTTLQNVFAACDQTPNTIPFDKLLLRQKVNTRVYNRLLIITATILLFTFLSPFIIVPVSTALERITAPEPVTLLNDYLENDILYLKLSGDGILYEEAYLETVDGHRESVISYDIEEQIIALPYIEGKEANIYIPVENGTPFHLLLSPQ